MAGDARDTLLLPFDRGEVRPPSKDGRWLFLNARPLSDARFLGTEGLHCEQGFRPDYLALRKAGYEVEPAFLLNRLMDSALLLLTRNRKLNEYNSIRAWNAVTEGGTVICAGDKKTGIQSLRKWSAEHADISGSHSKYHAQVFWFEKRGENWPPGDLNQDIGGYKIAPGMFSADGPDAGSMLLAEHFDNRISGAVADLGAGWGYLSSELLKRTSTVDSIDLFEADHASLEAARVNVKRRHGVDVHFHWHDVAAEPIGKRFDWVIMNPPFHAGRVTDATLGRKFIEVASAMLNESGHLLMVANTHLPYEQTLRDRFSRVTQIAQRDGFKMIGAIR